MYSNYAAQCLRYASQTAHTEVTLLILFMSPFPSPSLLCIALHTLCIALSIQTILNQLKSYQKEHQARSSGSSRVSRRIRLSATIGALCGNSGNCERILGPSSATFFYSRYRCTQSIVRLLIDLALFSLLPGLNLIQSASMGRIWRRCKCKFRKCARGAVCLCLCLCICICIVHVHPKACSVLCRLLAPDVLEAAVLHRVIQRL
jgi:hypothetical protein